ncbi:4'-phosphopantetheinyl transferase family protein [Synechococcus elongatus]|uniref:4'-phosphopantetheinyl transferase family protein n=1 Tax=Synechococcus elongatus TaxID=32046 RepID=UPI0030D59A54
MQRPNPSDAVPVPSIPSCDRGPIPTPVTWQPGPSQPELRERMVHLWRCSLTRSLSGADQAIVAADCDRAQAYGTQRRQQFLRGRWWLRQLLSLYLPEKPAAFCFQLSPTGKPELPHTDLCFNLSHSGSTLLIAIARQPVGVDVEQPRSRSWLALARRYFPAAELAAMQQSADCDRWGLASWVCKEAWIKAQGRTLANSLRHLQCDWTTTGQPRLQGLGSEHSQMQLLQIDSQEHQWAAIASPNEFNYQMWSASIILRNH